MHSCQPAHQSGKGKGHVMVQCVVLGLKAVQELDEVRDADSSFLIVAFHGQELQDEHTSRLKTVDVMAETTEGETMKIVIYCTPHFLPKM